MRYHLNIELGTRLSIITHNPLLVSPQEPYLRFIVGGLQLLPRAVSLG